MTETDQPGLCVITGAGSGIGAALAAHMAGEGHSIIAVGRRAEPLQALAQANPAITACPADVSDASGRDAIVQAVGSQRVAFLVHNAGVLAPVGPLLRQSMHALHENLAINVEAPIGLSQALWPTLIKDARILHISSGAAHRALPGWGAYCISKAALFMAYQVLRDELEGTGVAVASLRPGVVDTPMQALIREQDAQDFPAVERFRELKAAGALTTPEDVAAFIHAVLTQTDAQRFSESEWDVRDHWNQHNLT